jgi:pilus assembly protein Flp/PilA
MLKKLAGFAAEENGATAIEYGLIATFIAVACIGAFVTFGGASSSMFHRVFIQTIVPALK